MRFALTGIVALLALQAGGAVAAQAREKIVRQDGVELHAELRTAEQMRAFYEARGFPPAALAAVSQACFITVGIRNHRRDILWLEPARWVLQAGGTQVQRRTEADWVAIWDQAGLEPGHRATFRWTQLPEQRDLHPGEPVGGNLTLNRVPGRVTILARFATGRDRNGEIALPVGPFVCRAQ
jgi:hypothetical protein